MKSQLLDEPEQALGTPYYERSRRYNRYIRFTLFFGVALFMFGRLSSEGGGLLVLMVVPLLLALVFILIFTLLSVVNLIKSYHYGEDVSYHRVVLLVAHSLIFVLLAFICGGNFLEFYQDYLRL